MMNETSKINGLVSLGNFLKNHRENELISIKTRAKVQNPWFTEENIDFCLDAWANTLSQEEVSQWVNKYSYSNQQKTIGLIPAGNIPLVGLHDLLSVLISGHKVKVKPSSKDSALLQACIDHLESHFPKQIEVSDNMKEIEAIIATGSDSTFLYFENYFKNIPNLFRKNRNSVALLTGNESQEALHALGKDIFSYFGLGCRNITHLLVPNDYKFDKFFEAILPYGDIVNHNKYNNNYSYHRALFLMNKVAFLDNNFVMVLESDELYSPIGVIHYHRYDSNSSAEEYIQNFSDKIQCVVGANHIPFGKTQEPRLMDYADNIDTVKFLSEL